MNVEDINAANNSMIRREDFPNICRICCFKSTNLASVYEVCYKGTLLYEVLGKCTPITVDRDDGLPTQMCMQCIETVLNIHEFYQKCVTSDTTLRQIAVFDEPVIRVTHEIATDPLTMSSIKEDVEVVSLSDTDDFSLEYNVEEQEILEVEEDEILSNEEADIVVYQVEDMKEEEDDIEIEEDTIIHDIKTDMKKTLHGLTQENQNHKTKTKSNLQIPHKCPQYQKSTFFDKQEIEQFLEDSSGGLKCKECGKKTKYSALFDVN